MDDGTSLSVRKRSIWKGERGSDGAAGGVVRKRCAMRVRRRGLPGPVPRRMIRPFEGAAVGRGGKAREWCEVVVEVIRVELTSDGDVESAKEERESRVTLERRSRGQYSEICAT
jgi:hypothetical protein